LLQKIILFPVFITLLSALILLPACSSTNSPATGPENSAFGVALVFDSQVADDAFCRGCLRGAEMAKTAFGISLTFTESSTSSETENLLEQHAGSQTFDLIISVGASQTQALTKTASAYPDQKFALVDGNITDKANIASLLVRDNESSFLVGALAAKVTQTHRIGFIGGFDESSIQRFLAGYRSGAAYVDPGCQVMAGYANTWTDNAKTKALALQQSAGGADVFFCPAGASSLGAIQAASEKELYAIGVDSDQSYLAPGTILASTLKNVDVAVFEAIKSSHSGKFTSGIQSTGLREGGVGISYNRALPVITAEIQASIDNITRKIISGEIVVPEK
jgi:basic membrane protein A and related proteins